MANTPGIFSLSVFSVHAKKLTAYSDTSLYYKITLKLPFSPCHSKFFGALLEDDKILLAYYPLTKLKIFSVFSEFV
jgi:hypothetical protein